MFCALQLTGDEIALIDQSPKPVPLRKSDLILGATDGIHALNENAIAQICSQSSKADASAVATGLIDAVRDAGEPRQDNATVAIVKPNFDGAGS